MYEEIGIYNIVLFIIMIKKICLEVLLIIIIEKLKEGTNIHIFKEFTQNFTFSRLRN